MVSALVSLSDLLISLTGGIFVSRQTVRAHGGDERRGWWEKREREKKRVVISADRAYFLSTDSGR